MRRRWRLSGAKSGRFGVVLPSCSDFRRRRRWDLERGDREVKGGDLREVFEERVGASPTILREVMDPFRAVKSIEMKGPD